MRHVFGICLVFIISLSVFLCCYRRNAKRQMKNTMNVQIETAVNQYVALSTRDNNSNSEVEMKD